MFPLEISRCYLIDYVRELYQSSCRTVILINSARAARSYEYFFDVVSANRSREVNANQPSANTYFQVTFCVEGDVVAS